MQNFSSKLSNNNSVELHLYLWCTVPAPQRGNISAWDAFMDVIYKMYKGWFPLPDDQPCVLSLQMFWKIKKGIVKLATFLVPIYNHFLWLFPTFRLLMSVYVYRQLFHHSLAFTVNMHISAEMLKDRYWNIARTHAYYLLLTTNYFVRKQNTIAPVNKLTVSANKCTHITFHLHWCWRCARQHSQCHRRWRTEGFEGTYMMRQNMYIWRFTVLAAQWTPVQYGGMTGGNWPARYCRLFCSLFNPSCPLSCSSHLSPFPTPLSHVSPLVQVGDCFSHDIAPVSTRSPPPPRGPEWPLIAHEPVMALSVTNNLLLVWQTVTRSCSYIHISTQGRGHKWRSRENLLYWQQTNEPYYNISPTLNAVVTNIC